MHIITKEETKYKEIDKTNFKNHLINTHISKRYMLHWFYSSHIQNRNIFNIYENKNMVAFTCLNHKKKNDNFKILID